MQSMQMKKQLAADAKMPKIRGRKLVPSSKDDLIERRRLFLEDFFSHCLMSMRVLLA